MSDEKNVEGTMENEDTSFVRPKEQSAGTEGSGSSKSSDFLKRNLKYIVGAGILVVVIFLLFLLAKGGGNAGDSGDTAQQPATEIVTEAVMEPETEEGYAQDAIPAVNELITSYYSAYANGDNDTLATLATPLSDTEKSYISVFSQYVEGYENISCYTKSGLEEGSYLVSVYMEMKFKDVETRAPGLDFFYVRTSEGGSLYIDNIYSQFNMSNKETELDPAVSELIGQFEQQEDVIALQTDVQQKYTDALASDENLRTLVETTMPNAITVWASDQNAAAKKAEEEAAKKAEEEAAAQQAEADAAQKAAEEAAAQEQAAAEQAAAVTVYATTKVNVRADASESADILGQLEAGAQTSRLEEREDGWSKINYSDGTQGYVKSEYLSTEAPAAETVAAADTSAEQAASGSALEEGKVITLTESVILRESMSSDSAKLRTLFAGEVVKVVMSYAEGWTKVTYGDEAGYIRTDLLN